MPSWTNIWDHIRKDVDRVRYIFNSSDVEPMEGMIHLSSLGAALRLFIAAGWIGSHPGIFMRFSNENWSQWMPVGPFGIVMATSGVLGLVCLIENWLLSRKVVMLISFCQWGILSVLICSQIGLAGFLYPMIFFSCAWSHRRLVLLGRTQQIKHIDTELVAEAVGQDLAKMQADIQEIPNKSGSKE